MRAENILEKTADISEKKSETKPKTNQTKTPNPKTDPNTSMKKRKPKTTF